MAEMMRDAGAAIIEARKVPAAVLARMPLAVILTNPRLDGNPIVYANQAFEELTGHRRKDVIGRDPRFLHGEETEAESLARLLRAIENGEEASVEITTYRADGAPFQNRITLCPVVDEDGELALFLEIHRDVSQEGGAALLDRLAEIQHRVKNHLAMIIGLIRLQAGAQNATADFDALARRIEALHLLYEELSAGGVASAASPEVPLGAYVSRIAAAIAHLDGRQGVRVNVNAEEVTVPADIAGRVGLLLSEALTNALRHAFEGRDMGLVETRLQRLSNEVVRLQIADDGVGLPEGQQWPSGSLGGRIVLSLLRGLKARHSVDSTATGTTVTIDIPLGQN